MPRRSTFTDQAIRNIPPPPNGAVTVWDAATRGFGIRVSSSGSKSFLVLIASGRRQSIGRYPQLSLAQARAEAKRIMAEKTLGRIRPAHTAFDDAKDEFLDDCRRRNKRSTVNEYARLLNRHLRFGRKSIGDIDAHDLIRILNKLTHVPTERHHVYTAARAFFRWAYRQHLIDRNPVERIDLKPPASMRDRVLAPEELGKALELALADRSAFHSIVALLILTGQRRSEISALQWDWISGDHITLPSSITKNSREHRFPIGPMALGIIERLPRFKGSCYLFPASKSRYRGKPATIFNGWGKAKANFDAELRIEPYVLHDLRRTLRTYWAELGISIEVAEKYINHISGMHSGLGRTYNRYPYMAEMRVAVGKWEAHLQKILPR